jgi:hypothetical protein
MKTIKDCTKKLKIEIYGNTYCFNCNTLLNDYIDSKKALSKYQWTPEHELTQNDPETHTDIQGT